MVLKVLNNGKAEGNGSAHSLTGDQVVVYGHSAVGELCTMFIQK